MHTWVRKYFDDNVRKNCKLQKFLHILPLVMQYLPTKHLSDFIPKYGLIFTSISPSWVCNSVWNWNRKCWIKLKKSAFGESNNIESSLLILLSYWKIVTFVNHFTHDKYRHTFNETSNYERVELLDLHSYSDRGTEIVTIFLLSQIFKCQNFWNIEKLKL